jgi:hypothetical protein
MRDGAKPENPREASLYRYGRLFKIMKLPEMSPSHVMLTVPYIFNEGFSGENSTYFLKFIF